MAGVTKEQMLKKLKNHMDAIMNPGFGQRFGANTLWAWCKAIRSNVYSEEVMKQAFELYVDKEDYHPSERKALLNFKKLKRVSELG